MFSDKPSATYTASLPSIFLGSAHADSLWLSHIDFDLFPRRLVLYLASWFFFFLRLIFICKILCMCTCVGLCVSACRWRWGPGEGARSSGEALKGSCELTNMGARKPIPFICKKGCALSLQPQPPDFDKLSPLLTNQADPSLTPYSCGQRHPNCCVLCPYAFLINFYFTPRFTELFDNSL